MRGRILGAGLGLLLVTGCARSTMPAGTLPAPAAPTAASVRARVRPGIEVLLADSLALVRGRRVGLVTNQTGIGRDGRGDVELLLGADVQLVALFSPEHGFRGAADPGAPIGSTRDSATGLPIYSLYGRTVTPTPEMLDGVDVLLVDLQDVGARYYTYISTAIEVMRAAGPRGIPVVILDRPNPIGGLQQGNVLRPAFQSFVGRLAVPMRHGLTMGELARYANATLGLGADLRIVPAAGWRRSMGFAATGLPWVPPSPNLRDLESLLHYPGTCLFEGTSLSVGRGTTAPFAQIGAPWLDAPGVAAALQGRVPGVQFIADTATPVRPGDAKFADTTIAVVRLRVTDAKRYDPVRAAVALLAEIQRRHPASFTFLASHFDRLSGTDELRLRLAAGETADAVMAGWAAERQFVGRALRAVRLYPD